MTSLKAGSGFKSNEVVVFGLGGHKCGSTWLAEYFRNHPQCFVPVQKELTSFELLNMNQNNWQIRHRIEKMLMYLDNFAKFHVDGDGESNIKLDQIDRLDSLNAKLFDISQNIAMLTGYGHYADMFRRRTSEQTRLFDISPHYSTCEVATYREMVNIHSRVKFFLSMRDPAERLFSAYRYQKSVANKKIPVRLTWRLDQLQNFLGQEFNQLRSDYGRALDALGQVTSSKNIFTCFYEELFTDKTMHHFCKFLGIGFTPGKYGSRVHQTSNYNGDIKMYDEERQFLVEALTPIYKDINERFGKLAPDNWNWPESIRKKRA